jgi:AcrR family transcriptional regulator
MAPRKKGDAEETRRLVLDTALSTIMEIGYYKASSNEIARRAGVTWGTIQHLFGSREQLMLEVVNYLGEAIEDAFAAVVIDGLTLEERMEQALTFLARHYEQDRYIVQLLIVLELSANPKIDVGDLDLMREKNIALFDRVAQPFMAKVIGEASAEYELTIYAFMALRSYLVSSMISQRIVELPNREARKSILRPVDETAIRRLLIEGIAHTVRREANRLGYDMP